MSPLQDYLDNVFVVVEFALLCEQCEFKLSPDYRRNRPYLHE
ncbi:MAG: hypothetical protein R3C18_10220 [Planctomycetaceae bacterium]